MQGKKVLLIDADPQGDLTTCLGWQDTDSLGITLATKLTDVINETMNDPMVGVLHHFQEWSSVKMIDTLIPMLLSALFGAGLRAGLFIHVYRQFFKGLPKELEEAAYLDGCGPVSAFFRIMLMNAGAPLLTTFILSLVWYWNDFLNTALFFTSYQPLAVKMANYASALNEYCTPEVLLPYGELKLIAPSLIAAAERARVPVVVHYDHGLTLSAVWRRCSSGLPA